MAFLPGGRAHAFLGFESRDKDRSSVTAKGIALLFHIHVHIFSLDVQSKSVGDKLSSLYFHWNGISDTFAFSLNSWILFLVASNYYERYGKRERQSTGKQNILNNVILVSVPDSTCQLRLLLVTSLTGSNQTWFRIWKGKGTYTYYSPVIK